MYIFGHVAGIIGPWPEGSMDACLEGKKMMNESAIEKLSDGNMMISDRVVTPRDFQIECEMRDKEPVVEDKW